MRSTYLSNPGVQRTYAEVAEEFQRRCGTRLTPKGVQKIEQRAIDKIRRALIGETPSPGNGGNLKGRWHE